MLNDFGGVMLAAQGCHGQQTISTSGKNALGVLGRDHVNRSMFEQRSAMLAEGATPKRRLEWAGAAAKSGVRRHEWALVGRRRLGVSRVLDPFVPFSCATPPRSNAIADRAVPS